MSNVPKRSVTTSLATFLGCLFAVALLLAATPAFAGRVNASALRDGGTYDRFIVRFRKDAPERNNVAARQQSLDAVGHGQGVRVGQLRRLAVGADVIKTDRKLDRMSAQRLMQRLARNPNVEYVEPDVMLRPTFVPNDTSYASQWHYFEPTAGINLPAAWDKATGSGVVVAVIDTGITPHSDLTPNIVAGYDFISTAAVAGDGNGRDANPNDEGDWTAADECEDGAPAEDSSWHGTHVAGTIAAVTNNAKGVAGVAYNAKVMPLRALGKCGGYTSDIADAIVWASGGTVSGAPINANPAEVINMSLGGPGTCDATSQAAINMAVAAGTVVVVAAGNDSSDASGFSPASCGNVIAVAAVGRNGGRASYSNYGDKVDVAAPGGGSGGSVLSTLNAGTTTQGAESYAGYQGTSMATPHVAGTVALMQSRRVNSPAVVEAVLRSTARAFPLSCPGCGTGIIDASAAVSAAINPVLIIGDVTVTEGNSGTRLATFTVTLSQAVATTVRYDIATADGSAIAGTDYIASSLAGQTIAAGATSKTFSVTIKGDVTPESPGTFFVNVSNVSGVAVADGQAMGTILNDDPVLLHNGTSITGIEAGIGQQLLYSLVFPAGASNLTFTTAGGIGDVDLYVKSGSVPSTSVFDCSSTSPTTDETCSLPTAQPGTYYVLLDAYSDISGVTLKAQYTLPDTYHASSDIVWRNAGTGANTIWKAASSTTTMPMNSVTNLAWKLVGAGDFDGDGKDDVLWRNSSTGADTIWKSASSATTQSVTGVSNLAWNIVGVGDFNADGKQDVLWRNSNTGANTIWKSANSATVQSMTGVTNLAWKIVGVGDFDGDGRDDVLWRNSSTGANTIWKSGNGATVQPMASISNLAWKIVGVGDFDGDNKDDVLWRNSSTGGNTIWKAGNSALVKPMNGVTNLDWHIVGTGDYNGDGIHDVLWRNFSTGANTIWKSGNASTLQSVKTVTDLSWEIVP